MIFFDFRTHSEPEIDTHYLLDKLWEAAPRMIKCSFPVYRVRHNYSDLFVLGSQNGFIFFTSREVFSIINPINREEVRIILPKQPWGIWTSILGIFLHPVLKEYCTIWRETDSNTSNGIPQVEYKMLNLGIHPCWREIKFPFSPSMDVDGMAVLVEDYLYWKVQCYGADMDHSYHLQANSIMAFDIKTEELSLMTFPHECTTDYYLQSYPSIHNVDGFLSIGKTKSNGVKIIVKIWTLKDSERTLWTSSDYIFNCVNNLKNPYMEELIDEQVIPRPGKTGRKFFVGSLKHGTVRKFVCHSNRGKGLFFGVMFYKPTLGSLKKCKPLICFDQENKEEVDLIEYERSSSTDHYIVVEDLVDLGQSGHSTDI